MSDHEPLPAPVFGPGRQAAAVAAINEVNRAKDADTEAGWGSPQTHARLVRARMVRAQYADYGDSFGTGAPPWTEAVS